MHARILTYILGLGREWIKQRVGVAEGKSSSGGFTVERRKAHLTLSQGEMSKEMSRQRG